MSIDVADRAFKLSMKWLEVSKDAKHAEPEEFAKLYMNAYRDILHVLSDNEMPEAIDASMYLNAGLRPKP